MPSTDTAAGGDLVYRQRRPVRLWHWFNALAVFVMLMSGMMIFNAHPELYWGKYGADHERPWLEIGSQGTSGFLRVGPVTLPTTGILGISRGDERAFPALVTIPSGYDLATAREWHFAFAWLLVLPGLLFWGLGLRNAALPARSRTDGGGTCAPQCMARRSEPRSAAVPSWRGGQALSRTPEDQLRRCHLRIAASHGADRAHYVAHHGHSVALAARTVRRAAIRPLYPFHLRRARRGIYRRPSPHGRSCRSFQ